MNVSFMFVFSGTFKFETGLFTQNLYDQLLGSFKTSWTRCKLEQENGYKINNTRTTERYQLESGLQEVTMINDGSLPDFQNLRAIRRAWSSPHQLEEDLFDFDEQAENYERFSCL